VIWVGIPTMLLGYFGALRLAANGIDPGPPDGITLQVGTLLPVYSAEPALRLGSQMNGEGYRIQTYPWDWRKSILTAGDALADLIRGTVTTSQPCSMVAHSAGGLVARRAWSNLLGTGQQGLIRRIVTLGTPHWGSYASVLLFSAASPLIDGIVSLNTGVAIMNPALAQAVGYVRWTARQIADLALTWPAAYELLPVVGAPDAGDDPHRADLFNAANWGGGASPEQTWLTHAATTYAQWVLSPASLPPDDVMTCVAGTGYTTRYGLVTPERLGEPDAIGTVEVSDNTVPIASALLAASQQIRVTSTHENLFPSNVGNGNIRMWVEAVRSPTPIPPPPIVSRAPQMSELTPIPGYTPPIAAGGPNPYRNPMGDC
jgi:hypothetical protein